MVFGGKFHSNLVARHLCQSACGILALVAILPLVPSCNMPSAMNNCFIDPILVTADSELEDSVENVEEVPVPPKKKTQGPGKKNSA